MFADHYGAQVCWPCNRTTNKMLAMQPIFGLQYVSRRISRAPKWNFMHYSTRFGGKMHWCVFVTFGKERWCRFVKFSRNWTPLLCGVAHGKLQSELVPWTPSRVGWQHTTKTADQRAQPSKTFMCERTWNNEILWPDSVQGCWPRCVAFLKE